LYFIFGTLNFRIIPADDNNLVAKAELYTENIEKQQNKSSSQNNGQHFA